jgi:hypothetical protein
MGKLLCFTIALTVVAGAPPALAWPGCEEDRLSAVVHSDTLIVYHDAATYNCCMDGVEYSVVQDDRQIWIQEMEILTDPCACLCCFDVSVQIEDLMAGSYTLVFTWSDYDTGQWEQWTEQVTVLDAGQGGEPFVSRVDNSGCIDPIAVPDPDVEPDSWGGVKSLYK